MSTIQATDRIKGPRRSNIPMSLKRFISSRNNPHKENFRRRFWASASISSSSCHGNNKSKSSDNSKSKSLSGRCRTMSRPQSQREQDPLAPIAFAKPLWLHDQDSSDETTECISESSRSTNSSFSSASTSSSSERHSQFDKGILKIATQEESIRCSRRWSNVHTVQFTQVTVQYHTIIMGDGLVSSGAPIALGAWESTTRTSLADYEKERHQQQQQEQQQSPPWKSRTRLSAKSRERMLLDAGVSPGAIRQRVNRIKVQKDLQLRARLLESHRAKYPVAPAMF